MSIKIGDFDLFNEIINNRLNIDVLLNFLARKGLLTQEDFDILKKEMTDRFKKDNPGLFQKEKKNQAKKKK